MRIISGKFKNKKLSFGKNSKTRPLKDSVRENIFNILTHSQNMHVEIKNSNILDLYAGTGSFGLECMSRDASHVLFVENNEHALINLNKNIKNLNLEDHATISNQDVRIYLKENIFKKNFDLVFLDPPYINKTFVDIIKLIKEKNLMKKKHIIVIHRDKKSDDNMTSNINIIQTRVYGRSKIFFGNILI